MESTSGAAGDAAAHEQAPDELMDTSFDAVLVDAAQPPPEPFFDASHLDDAGAPVEPLQRPRSGKSGKGKKRKKGSKKVQDPSGNPDILHKATGIAVPTLAVIAGASAVFFLGKQLWNLLRKPGSQGGKQSGGKQAKREPVDRATVLASTLPQPLHAAIKEQAQPLADVVVVVAENIDVTGTVTTWGRGHLLGVHPASTSSAVVQQLLGKGVAVIGKTFTPELANEDTFGTSVRNPVNRKRMCGVGQVAAAAAVSGGVADVAVLQDSMGGARIPAACCQVFSFCASPAQVLSGGAPSAAPTTAVLASHPTLLRRVGEALGVPGTSKIAGEIIRLYVAEDLFRLCGPEMKPAVQAAKLAIQKWAGEEEVGQFAFTSFLEHHLDPAWKRMFREGEEAKEIAVPPVLESLRRAAVVLRGAALAAQHPDWLQGAAPSALSTPEGRALLESARAATPAEVAKARAVAASVHGTLREALRNNIVLLLPVAPTGPPLTTASPDETAAWLHRAQLFNCITTLAGCPSVTIPTGVTREGIPLAVAIFSLHRTDLRLLAIAEKLAPLVQDQFEQVLSGVLERAAREREEREAAAERKRREEEKATERAEAAKDAGNAAFSAGQLDKAVQHYSAAIKHNPRNGVYYSNRALCYLKLFKWEEAVADCDLALKQVSSDKLRVKALLRRASALRATSNYPRAIEDLEQALVLEPNNADARAEREALIQEVQYYQQQMAAMQRQAGGMAGPGGLMPNGNGLEGDEGEYEEEGDYEDGEFEEGDGEGFDPEQMAAQMGLRGGLGAQQFARR